MGHTIIEETLILNPDEENKEIFVIVK